MIEIDCTAKKVPTGDVPYPLFALAGLLPWQYFAASLNRSTNSVVDNANLVTKVYFPRLIVPLATALGFGLWLSALNVQYRDVRQLIPFIAQIWMYLTPVVYSVTLIPERFRWLLGLNSMTGVVEGFRWALLGGKMSQVQAPGPLFGISIAISLLVLVSGAIFFRRAERTFADII